MTSAKVVWLILVIATTLVALMTPIEGENLALIFGQRLVRIGTPVLFYYLAFRKKK